MNWEGVCCSSGQVLQHDVHDTWSVCEPCAAACCTEGRRWAVLEPQEEQSAA